MNGRRRLIIQLGSLLLLLLLAIVARMLLGAKGELDQSQHAAMQNDRPEAARHLRRAMAYYLPFNPFVRQAKQRLWNMSMQALAEGRREEALDALYQLRYAILSLRGLTRPYAEILPEVNRLTARLQAEQPLAAAWLKSEEGQRSLRSRLDAVGEPDPLWAGVGLAGFLLWVVAALLLFARGLSPNASLVRRRFWPLLGLVFFGLALFVIGMARA
jgi:hypothetical protein